MLRYCHEHILADLKQKMVFIGGPRQVGKTTLSREFCKAQYSGGEYFNWDVSEDRQAILKKQWQQKSPLIIFDELHKFPKWKSWIKGVYDIRPAKQNYIVTGSARLDTYRRGGDSLLGRYHYWRLHPLTLDEAIPKLSKQEIYSRLLTVGGFPEPFFINDEREARRWRRERFSRILYEDIQDLDPIRQLQLLQLLVDALRLRVGSMIVIANLAEDLGVSPKTAKAWLLLLEKMYMVFAVYPLVKNIPRAIQKPPKVFFYDNADVEGDMGARLENLVATHLLKRLHFIEDYHGYRCELRYIRDKEGREVDFVTIVDGKVVDLIEVKTKSSDISQNLKYYANKLKPQRVVQIVGELKRGYDKDNIHVMNPIEYFANPPWTEKDK